MSRYKIREQQGLNYLTLTVVGWIDIFSRKRYRDIILDSLRYCREHKGLHVVGWVIMSNHLHLIVFTETLELSHVLRDFKKFTAFKILESINKEPESRREWLLYMFKYFAAVNPNNRYFQFWQQDNHPIELWSLPVIWQKLNYIHDNPVRAGIVSDPTHFLYSSATDYYCGKNGLLEIDLMEPIGPMLPSGYYY